MRLPTPLEMHWGDKLYEFYLAKSLKVLFLNILYAIQTKPFLFAWHSTDVKKNVFMLISRIHFGLILQKNSEFT